MGYFPFFVDIEGKNGLIVGGGSVAVHKIRKLLPFRPKLKVVSPALLPELIEIAQNSEILLIQREFQEEDLQDVTFVIASSENRSLNAQISCLCHKEGILVNVVDNKEECSFLFPALVHQGDLTIGVTTAGASPEVAATIKNEVAAMMPANIEEILDYLAALRPLVKETIHDSKIRAQFLKEMANCCMESGGVFSEKETKRRLDALIQRTEKSASISPKQEICGETPTDIDTSKNKIEKNIRSEELAGINTSRNEIEKNNEIVTVAGINTSKNEIEKNNGSVTLVGAGCGSYELITLKGLRAIRYAQVIVYDDLIDKRLLDFAAESCECIYVGKRSGRHSMCQEEINALLLQKAKEGKRVVRLKGGDPFVFGRGGEEIHALNREHIPTAYIPGITAALAVPAFAGIPVTYREISRSVHIITGHTSATDSTLPENFAHFARLDGTLVFLMGLANLAQIAQALIKYGKNPQTPAAVIHGNLDNTVEIIKGTLFNIVEKVQQTSIKMPAVIVVGETAKILMHDTER